MDVSMSDSHIWKSPTNSSMSFHPSIESPCGTHQESCWYHQQALQMNGQIESQSAVIEQLQETLEVQQRQCEAANERLQDEQLLVKKLQQEKAEEKKEVSLILNYSPCSNEETCIKDFLKVLEEMFRVI